LETRESSNRASRELDNAYLAANQITFKPAKAQASNLLFLDRRGQAMNENTELKTIGYTPFNYSADRALFRVNGGVPIQEALERASDLLHLAHRLAEDAAFEKSTDRYAWAAHFLLEMSKAVIDDVVKVITPRPAAESKKQSEAQ